MSKWDDWFGTRRWRVFAEADGAWVWPAGDGHIPVRFSRGRFVIEPPGAFTSPLGSRGRSGVLLQEVGADGRDIPGPGHLTAWGEAAVRRARKVFGAVA